MGRVDFYILPPQQTVDEFVCKLTNKLWKTHQIHIHTISDTESERIDDLLWSFNDAYFIPHATLNLLMQNNDVDAKVTIAAQNILPENTQVLINLSDDIPEFAEHTQRIVEIVAPDEKQKKNARLRYQFYKDNHYEIVNHNL